MTSFIIRRLMQGGLVLIASSMIIYFLLTLIPGSPLTGIRVPGSKVSKADIINLGYQWGLNDKDGRKYEWYERYARWLFDPSKKGVDVAIGDVHIQGAGILTGNWGDSMFLAQGQPVMELISQRLPFTLILTIASLLISLLIAVPIGIISAVRQYSKLDYGVTFFSFFGLSMPVFWLGWMLIIIFGVQFKHWHDEIPALAWLPYLPPSQAYDPGQEGDLANRALHLILPVTVLSLVSVAGWSRFLRGSVLEVLRLEYVRTAWAKGLKQRVVILKHALRNALIPLITVVALALPGLFGGAIITETIFSYPGMGRLYFDAIGAFDWPIVMAYLLIITTMTVSANLLADILYAFADPRIRVS
jgi:peptide/nickel transport system permease protein